MNFYEKWRERNSIRRLGGYAMNDETHQARILAVSVVLVVVFLSGASIAGCYITNRASPATNINSMKNCMKQCVEACTE